MPKTKVNGASTVFSTWKQTSLNIGDVKIVDAMHAMAGRLALDDHMSDARWYGSSQGPVV